MTDTPEVKPHPAKFSDSIIKVIDRVLTEYVDTGIVGDREMEVLDPFAGVGKIFSVIDWVEWTGIELEPEWAAASNAIVQGDCIETMKRWVDENTWMPGKWVFDAIVTSPAYGNRMADQSMLPDRGAGLKWKYNTYAYKLGRVLTHGNGAGYVWHQVKGGKRYRTIHKQAWRYAVKLLRPGGLFVLNVSDYKRTVDGVEVTEYVSDWHVEVLEKLGLEVVEAIAVETPRQKQGANRDVREAHEWVVVFRKPVVD